MTLSSLYGALFLLRPCILSMTLCFLNSRLYGPLSPLQPSVLSMALCFLYGPLKTAKKVKLPLLFRKMFCKTHFVKTPRVVAIYFVLAMITIIAIITIITQAKYSAIIEKYRYRLSKKSCDNLDNRIQQEAIIVFREKFKTPFRINPKDKRILFYAPTLQQWELSMLFALTGHLLRAESDYCIESIPRL